MTRHEDNQSQTTYHFVNRPAGVKYYVHSSKSSPGFPLTVELGYRFVFDFWSLDRLRYPLVLSQTQDEQQI